MSSVYFDPAVGGDGSTVSDDSNPTTGLANGGHRTRMVPALAQTVAVAGFVADKAADAATAEAIATAAAIGLAQFNDIYLGANTADPTLDNDGNPLQVGALYFRTTGTVGLKTYTGSAWVYPALSSAVASGVSVTPTGNLTASDVQAALAELDGDITASRKEAVSLISTNTNAVVQNTYIATAALTLTLPASPSAGDWVDVVNLTGSLTGLVIGRNSKNIQGLGQDMTVNRLNAAFRLLWSGNSTIGWVIK